MQIASIALKNNLFLAPMAGITDRPFRSLCKSLGAGYAVSEMISSNADLRKTRKTQLKSDHTGEAPPIAVQIPGTSAIEMAQAAQYSIDNGAQIIDINMGCPVKKVCQKWAGSALMQDEKLALSIIEAVVKTGQAHNVPITLKMRTGWDAEHKNAPTLAVAAEKAGIAMLTVHGRTREQKYQGHAEYETIAHIKSLLSIPVVANGDIDSPIKAKQVLEETGADALMIGRAAQARPWIFKEISSYLTTGELPAPPLTQDVLSWVVNYLQEHYTFYGEYIGVKQARKHIAWLIEGLPDAISFRQHINHVELADKQLDLFVQYIKKIEQIYPHWPL
ncbi:MAG: tRNA dihydrouridine synthase DusB [Saezia sp.]